MDTGLIVLWLELHHDAVANPGHWREDDRLYYGKDDRLPEPAFKHFSPSWLGKPVTLFKRWSASQQKYVDWFAISDRGADCLRQDLRMVFLTPGDDYYQRTNRLSFDEFGIGLLIEWRDLPRFLNPRSIVPNTQ